jgi:hypothetical protein
MLNIKAILAAMGALFTMLLGVASYFFGKSNAKKDAQLENAQSTLEDIQNVNKEINSHATDSIADVRKRMRKYTRPEEN